MAEKNNLSTDWLGYFPKLPFQEGCVQLRNIFSPADRLVPQGLKLLIKYVSVVTDIIKVGWGSGTQMVQRDTTFCSSRPGSNKKKGTHVQHSAETNHLQACRPRSLTIT